MDRGRIYRTNVWACWFCVAVLLAAGSCKLGKEPEGRFSVEEMEAFALVEREELPLPAGGLVLSVGKETIIAEEILSLLPESLTRLAGGSDFQGFRRQARGIIEKAVVNETIDILLYQEARKLTDGNINEDALDKAAQSEVNKFLAGYGGNLAGAEKAIKQMGLDWPGFRSYQKKLLLTQYYISQELTEDKPVTHNELLAKYDDMKDEYFLQVGQIQFRLIDIAIGEIDKIALVESGEGGRELKKAAASKLAAELLKRIEQGEDFSELAQKYSNDAAHRVQLGGLWSPVTTGTLAPPHDVLEKEAENMEAGDVSVLIETDGHIFIMKLESKTEPGYEPFEKVQEVIETEIKFQWRKAKLDELLSRLLRRADIAGVDRFVEFCTEAAYQRFK